MSPIAIFLVPLLYHHLFYIGKWPIRFASFYENTSPIQWGITFSNYASPKNSCRKRISLKLYVDPAYWDNSAERLTIERNLKGEKQREANKKRIQDNAFLDKVKARAREIIEKFEIDGIDWTLNQFEETFLNPSKQGKFCAYLEIMSKRCGIPDIRATPNAISKRFDCSNITTAS